MRVLGAPAIEGKVDGVFTLFSYFFQINDFVKTRFGLGISG
jgi:hypothetical protein